MPRRRRGGGGGGGGRGLGRIGGAAQVVGPRVSFIVRADLIHYEGLPLLPEARIDLIHEIRHHVSSADTTTARRASELGKTAKVERERERERAINRRRRRRRRRGPAAEGGGGGGGGRVTTGVPSAETLHHQRNLIPSPAFSDWAIDPR